jgi:hypothetical protein
VVGGKTPQKFDSTGTLLANGRIPADVEITSGGLAFTSSQIFVGAGAFNNSQMKIYLSSYANQ